MVNSGFKWIVVSVLAASSTQALPPIIPIAILSLGVSDRTLNQTIREKLGLDEGITVALTQNGSYACTGTLISDTDVATVRHCIDPNNPTGGVNIDGIEAEVAYYNPDMTKVGSAYDFAIVRFPAGTGRFLGATKYPRIATTLPQKGDEIFLGGFGCNNLHTARKRDVSNPGSGVLGWGRSQVVDNKGGVITTSKRYVYDDYNPEETKEEVVAIGLPGDSGSAVYNSQGEVVAVVSQVYTDDRTVRLPVSAIGLIVGNPWIAHLVKNSFELEIRLDGWWAKNELSNMSSQNTQDVFALARGETVERFALKEPRPPAPPLPTPGDPFAATVLRTGRYQGTLATGLKGYFRPV
ncbi:MAG: trypsin-like serine protease [Deltaproteobacteria bacterium]|nr:trypsin-like serine protease [Deltaproteobacteria bacterium]